ncbi:dihydroflavonol-4-reductase [Melghirimyces profundicolus]|uniref:Dihydroflavonol-4-reductase n=1 Tax=Melghirimyces profundicolus TaxID=1242148 RepID=A0A2T6BCT2_9BACL|nr:NAD-dependent epimerase/dehydratase family protein [Melghirimyces profundicolus]PTX53888.1 dihydroflavonol-4-reductase [Melghirimyces profundicolus]
MRVLVTGGTGFLGRHLVRCLLEQGHEVSVLYRRESKKDRLPEAVRKEVRFIKGNVLEPESLRNCARGMEWVFHTAGDVAWGRALRQRMTDSHVKGTGHMVREAVRSGVDRFVHTSSAAAVGFSLSAQPAVESFPFNGDRMNNGYAMAKREAERIVLRETDAGSLPGVVVNPTVILGESHPGFVREVARDRLKMAPDSGVNLCDVRDVAEGHLLAAKKGRTGERYILGGSNLSLREAFQMIADTAGTGRTIRTLPRLAALGVAVGGEAVGFLKGREAPLAWDLARLCGRDVYYDSAKAERELGYKRRPLEETIRDSVEWMG